MIVNIIALVLAIGALIVSNIKVSMHEEAHQEELKQIIKDIDDRIVTGAVNADDEKYYNGYNMGLLKSIDFIELRLK